MLFAISFPLVLAIIMVAIENYREERRHKKRLDDYRKNLENN